MPLQSVVLVFHVVGVMVLFSSLLLCQPLSDVAHQQSAALAVA